jgi:hypothetical protein
MFCDIRKSVAAVRWQLRNFSTVATVRLGKTVEDAQAVCCHSKLPTAMQTFPKERKSGTEIMTDARRHRRQCQNNQFQYSNQTSVPWVRQTNMELKWWLTYMLQKYSSHIPNASNKPQLLAILSGKMFQCRSLADSTALQNPVNINVRISVNILSTARNYHTSPHQLVIFHLLYATTTSKLL